MTEAAKSMAAGRHGGHWAQALRGTAVGLALILAAALALPAQAAADAPIFAGPPQSSRGLPLAQRVARLADQQEIRDLAATYAHRAAQGVSMADLFTDDGAFITVVPGAPKLDVRGRAAIDTYFAELAAQTSRPLPMIHNHLVTVDGDLATGICSIEVRTGANGRSMTGSGYYNDRYRRVGGRWKFVSREAIFFHFVPQQQGWATPAPAPGS